MFKFVVCCAFILTYGFIDGSPVNSRDYGKVLKHLNALLVQGGLPAATSLTGGSQKGDSKVYYNVNYQDVEGSTCTASFEFDQTTGAVVPVSPGVNCQRAGR